MSEKTEEILKAAVARLSEKADCDVLLYNGPIDSPLDRRVIELTCSRTRRKNVVLVLVTTGGDADAAYRIARCLQSKYDRFTMLVSGYCKSAGTLIAVGAHELAFTEDGELGPLDVQMSKQDSLWEMQSGLAVNDALNALENKAYLAFEQFFLETEERSQGVITVKTASDIATKLTVGLFAPLYSQVDPIHVGEAARALRVAQAYGVRLLHSSQNTDERRLGSLITDYPSHTFVIDYEEAGHVFRIVRPASAEETALVKALGDHALWPLPPRDAQVHFLSEEPAAQKAVEVEVPITTTPANSADVERLIDTLTEDSDVRANADPRAASNRPPA